jgi:pimeloyl-ACP methyl ester carboxylesterase
MTVPGSGVSEPSLLLAGFEYGQMDVEGVMVNHAVAGSGSGSAPPLLLLHGYPQNHLMRQLGFAQFGLVGHDRGARVARRLVLDHPDAVSRLAVLDIVPTRHVLQNVTRAMAALPTGHFLPEEAPGVVSTALRDFLG